MTSFCDHLVSVGIVLDSCIIPYLVIFVICSSFFNRLGKLSCLINNFTFCILRAFYSFRYGMDSCTCSLLKAVIEHVKVIFRLLFGWGLSYGLSCYISYAMIDKRHSVSCEITCFLSILLCTTLSFWWTV